METKRFHASPRRAGLLAALPLVALLAAGAHAAAVDVAVVSDDRGELPAWRIVPPGAATIHRAFLEARPAERYSIRVTNNTGRRVGVVIAVDGRNIVSGRPSRLRANERMYILPPHGSATYGGWRTARDTVNRFYFTDPGDSYAAAFGDLADLGTIAVAVYRERHDPPPPAYESEPFSGPPGREGDGSRSAAPRAAPAPSAPSAEGLSREKRSETPGTGFGEEERSPSIRVAFDPERRPAERHLFMYEWRDTLVRLGIVEGRHAGDRRFDGDDEFAPYPPRRARR